MSGGIPHARMLVAALVLIALSAGCASTPDVEDDRSAEQSEKADEDPVQSSEGPYEVAALWVEELDEHDLEGEPGEVVDEWSAAQVARVWASGEDYRAVVTRRGGGREETRAILLHIAPDDDDAWSVVDLEMTSSTHLWPKL
ncbi:MAG: hypothetical protein ACOCV2_05810 [Persicimonas sp.]